jgi:predicted choloylglycine hydrolase
VGDEPNEAGSGPVDPGRREPVAADDWLRWVPTAARAFIPGDPATGGHDDWRRFVPAEWRHWLDTSPAPRPQGRTLRFVSIDEELPGERWRTLFRETWQAYRAWWLQHGAGARPDRHQAEEALARHMPELVSVHHELVRLAGDDDVAASMLALWNPPAFIVGCSQAVVPDTQTGEPVLIRNYDYDPRLFEATVYRSRWGSRRVLGTGDCLWGLVDGVNDAGLAVSLTFGGRREIGEGFGVPLVIRYLLEVCDDVPAATAVLARLPHQLSYNITLCDRSGAVATVFVAPDRAARITAEPQTTNHPETVEWPEHAAWVHSVERLDRLRELQTGGVDADALVAAMLAPPFLARQWNEGFSTLYSAAYRPASGTLTYHWPGTTRALDLARPVADTFEVTLAADDLP